MAPMTASARSPATSHTRPRRIHNPNPLFGRAPCDCCSAWRAALCFVWCYLLATEVFLPFCEHLSDSYGRKFTSPVRVAELRHPEQRIEDEARPRASTLRPRRWRFSESPHRLCPG